MASSSKCPPAADVRKRPVTLQWYLSRALLDGRPVALPTLGDRIKLAYMLACSLAEIHAVGILHKRFYSGNVLFFPAALLALSRRESRTSAASR